MIINVFFSSLKSNHSQVLEILLIKN